MPSPKTPISEALYQYSITYGTREAPILQQLREATIQQFPQTAKQMLAIEQGQLIGLLAQITHAKTYLEIGVFTGYSTLTMALSMPTNATIIALDNEPNHIMFAKQFWQKAQISDKIHTMLGDGIHSCQQLVNDSNSQYKNYFDIAFIDADKSNYLNYYEYCHQLVRIGGLIIIDNVLFHGMVLENKPSNFIQTIKQLNQTIHQDARVAISMLPIGDGMTIAYKVA